MYALGRKNRTVTAPDGTSISLSYGYLSLFMIFNFTYRYRYSVVAPAADGSMNYREVSKEEATRINGGTPVTPPAMERYSFLIFLAIFAGVMIWRAITG